MHRNQYSSILEIWTIILSSMQHCRTVGFTQPS